VRGHALPCPLVLATLVVAVSVFTAEARRASQLERALAQERSMASATQRHLLLAAVNADAHGAALEGELHAMAQEAERLRTTVRAMQALGEQLRERAAIPAPAIDPLPVRPPSVAGAARPAVDDSPVTIEQARY
jgi:hypothetical protein